MSFLTIPEVAERIRLGNSSVKRFIDRGELASIHFGRRIVIDEDDLADFIAASRVGGSVKRIAAS